MSTQVCMEDCRLRKPFESTIDAALHQAPSLHGHLVKNSPELYQHDQQLEAIKEQPNTGSMRWQGSS